MAVNAGKLRAAIMPWLASARMMSLIFLVFQNTSLVLLMRHVRARTDRGMFLASTAVAMDEALKFTICFLLVLREVRAQPNPKADAGNADDDVFECLLDRISKGPDSAWKGFQAAVLTPEGAQMAIPALLYTLQKNLLYVALSNLDACVYQVAYQGKILTTAVFSYLMLGTALTGRKVLALVLLMVGVALVEVAKLTGHVPGPSGEYPGLGFLAVMMACCTSGFASVFFEFKLKRQSKEGEGQASVWVRNLQLSFFAGLLALANVLAKDGSAVASRGFFQGYDMLVVCTIVLEAAGGLLVGLVIKYADNIAKIFAMALSLTLVTALSALISGFHVTLTFLVGAALTIVSVYLYSTLPSLPAPTLPR